jgi:hypothetical protein
VAIDITVTGDALLGYVLTVTDANQGQRVRVLRRDTSGHYPDVAVRGFDYATPTGGTMIVTDYEAPFNSATQYIAQAFNLSDLDTPIASDTSSTVNTVLPSGFAIITDPLDAERRIAVGVSDLSEWSMETRVLGEHNVLLRNNPVVITDVEGGRTGTMVVTNLNQWGTVRWDTPGPYAAYAVAAVASWRTIFRPGRTLLFRNTWNETGFDDMYFKALKNGPKRLGHVGTHNGTVFMQHTIDYKEVDKPSTQLAGLGLGTWEDVKDANANWSEVNTVHATWSSVLVNPDL